MLLEGPYVHSSSETVKSSAVTLLKVLTFICKVDTLGTAKCAKLTDAAGRIAQVLFHALFTTFPEKVAELCGELRFLKLLKLFADPADVPKLCGVLCLREAKEDLMD